MSVIGTMCRKGGLLLDEVGSYAFSIKLFQHSERYLELQKSFPAHGTAS